MRDKDLTELKRWFTDYVAGFYSNDATCNFSFDLKEKHTKRVCRNIIMLCRELNLDAQDTLIAETIALLHDIGRFKQFAIYRTFKDSASENHAALGIREIAKACVLTGFTKKEKKIIIKAVAFHNAAKIPADKDKKSVLFMRLIRDADKLDIWKVVTEYYHRKDKRPNPVLENDLPDDPVCSKKVIESLNLNNIVDIKEIKTLCDLKLLQISWVFDLNFLPAFKETGKHRFIDKIEKTLPKTPQIAKAIQNARDYVNKKIAATS